jgi:hypothetical protein
MRFLNETVERTELFRTQPPKLPVWIPAIYQDRLGLDPKRQVADRWKTCILDTSGMVFSRTGLSITPDPRKLVEPNAPLRVRALDDIDLGAVLDLNSYEYWLTRGRASSDVSNPEYEPCPDRSKVRTNAIR